MSGLINGFNWCEVEAMKYWTFASSYKGDKNLKTEKNTIYDVIKDYYFEYQISEDISDVESGYLYLKMKSDIVNKKYDVLQKQFQNEKLFSVNLKVEINLIT